MSCFVTVLNYASLFISHNSIENLIIIVSKSIKSFAREREKTLS